MKISGIETIIIVYICVLHVTDYCFYLNPDDNIHTWINNIQKVNKSWMIYMTSALHHCLLTTRDKLSVQTFLFSSTKCVNQFITMATDCKTSTSYNFTKITVGYLRCPWPVETLSSYHYYDEWRPKTRAWQNSSLHVYHLYLNKPLNQECITTYYQQCDEISVYLNYRPVLFKKRF